MLLRPGYVTKEQMEAVLGEEVLVSPAILEKLKDGEVARSPGMKYKHYAPKAQVTILRGDFDKYRAILLNTKNLSSSIPNPASGRSALTVRAHSWTCRSSSTAKTMTA